jgi:hypothetical protein
MAPAMAPAIAGATFPDHYNRTLGTFISSSPHSDSHQHNLVKRPDGYYSLQSKQAHTRLGKNIGRA